MDRLSQRFLFSVARRLLPLLAITSLVSVTALRGQDRRLGIVPLTDRSAVLALDLGTGERKATVATRSHPQDAVASPDGRWAYILEMGTDSSPGHTVAVLDTRTLHIVDRIELAPYRRPHWAVIDPTGRILWVASPIDQSILQIDLTSRRLARVWRVRDAGPWNFAVTPQVIVTANFDAGTTTIFDRATTKIRGLVLSGQPLGIANSPDNDEVWISTMGTDSIYVIRPGTASVVARFASAGREPARMAVAPDDGAVLVTNTQSNSLSAYDVPSRRLRKLMPLPGAGAKGLVIDTGRHVAYVSLMDSHQVVAVDMRTWDIIWSAEVQGSPERLAVVP